VKCLAIIMSLFLFSGCATSGSLSSREDHGKSSPHILGVHWAWWLIGALAVGYALSESDSSDDCDRYPYTREDGITVLGSLNCIGF